MTEEEKAKWHIKITSMDHKQGFTFPVLEFRWGTEKFTGGTVRLWPQTKEPSVEVRSSRDDEKSNILVGPYSDPKSAAIAIQEIFGSVPQDFVFAFDVMLAFRECYEGVIHGKEKAQELFDGVREAWRQIGNSGGVPVRLREDLPDLIIFANSFQDFDHGRLIKEIVSEEWNLQPGDRIPWACGQYDGTAEVICIGPVDKIKGQPCFVRKIG